MVKKSKIDKRRDTHNKRIKRVIRAMIVAATGIVVSLIIYIFIYVKYYNIQVELIDSYTKTLIDTATENFEKKYFGFDIEPILQKVVKLLVPPQEKITAQGFVKSKIEDILDKHKKVEIPITLVSKLSKAVGESISVKDGKVDIDTDILKSKMPGAWPTDSVKMDYWLWGNRLASSSTTSDYHTARSEL